MLREMRSTKNSALHSDERCSRLDRTALLGTEFQGNDLPLTTRADTVKSNTESILFGDSTLAESTGSEQRRGFTRNSLGPSPRNTADASNTTVPDPDVSPGAPTILLPPGQPARFIRHADLDDASVSLPAAKDPDAPTKSSGFVTPAIHASEVSDGSLYLSQNLQTRVLDHTPLPVARLFARDAAPLHLPELDDLLAKLPRPDFTFPKRTKLGTSELFPPFNLLRGRRLKDLVHNAEPTPAWRDWNALGSTLVNWTLSVMGSSAVSTFYSLSGLYNVVQLFTLILNTITDNHSGKWGRVLLVTIPNILALNLGRKLLESIAFLSALSIACAGLLFWFYRLTNHWDPSIAPEGLVRSAPKRGTHAAPFVSFGLTVLYLPLSTIAMHAITWSSDFWPVENPYNEPAVERLGPPAVFRDPLDFCWTTTMRKDEINYAPVAVVLGVLTLIFMTSWFPIRLGKTIRRSLPHVEPYDSLGQRRSEHGLETEYQRLLERDKGPFNFLYNEYKQSWGSFKAIYLGIKFSSLLVVTLISPDSCLSLSLAKNHISRDALAVARQSILLAIMIGFLVLQTVAAPFVDPVSNASEWTSRVNFVLTSLLGLLVALDVPGQRFWNGWALYGVYIVTYGLTAYFTVVNWGWMHRAIKRLTRRIDFSIDIFSPRLDVSPSSKHLEQRIWQESWTTLLLAAPQCSMPASQKIAFVDGIESTLGRFAPPYLLDFKGSPAERHVENLKILREIGQSAYTRPLRMTPDDRQRIIGLRHTILRHFIGPDAFWSPNGLDSVAARAKHFFGNAWCIPFPLTVVIRYDHDGSLVCIAELGDLESFVQQNENLDVQKRREIRVALRSLDSTRVKWPHTHTELVGNHFWWFGARRFEAHRSTDYYEPVLTLQRNGTLDWGTRNLASGFGVTLKYAPNVILDGSLIGLNDALDLTPQLARFLLLNKRNLDTSIPEYLSCLQAYRAYAHREATVKSSTLSYEFLHSVFSTPAGPEKIAIILAEYEMNVRVRDLALGYDDSLQMMHERMQWVARSEIAAWWYLFWDDFWRRNRVTISSLTTYQSDFDPHYPTSIAYNPVPRANLEAFLKQHGLWSPTHRWYGNWHWFHTGLINKVYFHLNWVAFTEPSKAIRLHIGRTPSSIDPLEIDMLSRVTSPAPREQESSDVATIVTTSSGIKAGTALTDSFMRARRGYRWETLYHGEESGRLLSTKDTGTAHDHHWHFWHDESSRKQEYRISWRGRILQWLGISPLGRVHWGTGSVGADVILEHYDQHQIRYVRLLNDEH